MNLGSKARDLLLELKRSDWLPPYNDDGVRAVLTELQALWDEINDTLGDRSADELPDAVKVSLIIHHQAVLRNKRCLLAYMKSRADRVAQLRWETGPVVPEELQSNLSSREMEFFNKYDRRLTAYMNEVQLDLTADMEPPKELHVEVRALQNCGEIMTDQVRALQSCGEIMTDQGNISLERGTTHLLRRSDVEHLVRQGLLKQLDSDT